MTSPDVCIAGAGIIGLTLALTLRRRGLSVLVLSAGEPMAEASSAAAGMLAVDDPENPPELLPLSRLSRGLYPSLLRSLEDLCGQTVEFQTHRALQALPEDGVWPGLELCSAAELQRLLPQLTSRQMQFAALQEESLDPRELARALLAAVRSAGIGLEAGAPVLAATERAADVQVRTSTARYTAGLFVDCSGAWAFSSGCMPSLRLTPRKGQMLAVLTPASLAHGLVIRWAGMYLVPRLHGPNAGQIVVGATVEDVGFDRALDAAQLTGLQQQAAELLPELGDATVVSRWSGFRPATQDLLPVLGALPGAARLFIASGHFRNGILLAPGTAEVMAQRLLGEQVAVSLDAFSPDRFLRTR